MAHCTECHETAGAMTGAGICVRCLHRLEDELAFLEHMAKEVTTHEPTATLFGPGGFGHRMVLLQARVYSWQPVSAREEWLRMRGMGIKSEKDTDAQPPVCVRGLLDEYRELAKTDEDVSAARVVSDLEALAGKGGNDA